MFNFEDGSKPENTVNAGLILGFLKFDTPGFPSPNNNESYPDGLHMTAVDKTSYIVACCYPTYHNFDRKIDLWFFFHGRYPYYGIRKKR